MVIPKSNPLRPLNTVHNLFFYLLILHLRLGLDTLASFLTRALAAILIAGSFGLFRRSLRLLARSRLAHVTGRSSVGAGDLGALERVPASAQGAAVLVAELEGDFVDVELKIGVCVSLNCLG